MDRPAHVLPSPVESAPLPEVINHTPWPSQYFQHVDPHGEIFHVMVSRLTYSLQGMDFSQLEAPIPTLLDGDAQNELCESDQYAGQINVSSVLQESDYAPYKPKCDVLLVNAKAHAPDGKPAQRWAVGFRFGDAFEKRIGVTGPRTFSRTGVSEPEEALSVPLLYEFAFGGPNVIAQEAKLEEIAEGQSAQQLPESIKRRAQEAVYELPDFYSPNPIGCGRSPQTIVKANATLEDIESSINTCGAKTATLAGKNSQDGASDQSQANRAPQIEAFDRPWRGEQEDYPVVGVGPIGRWWSPRIALAGTHDEHWKARQWPKSPLDHNYRYWNCAPEDQQIDYPKGGEQIVLVNLTPPLAPLTNGPHAGQRPTIRFQLPRQELQLLVRLHIGAMMFAPMHIDTVIIDFATGTLSIVRRALISARADVRQLELGTWPPGTKMELDEEMKQFAEQQRSKHSQGVAHGR